MQAVILAAGEGERMHPLTNTRPKVMLPLANKPILEHIITGIRDAGIEEIILVVGYRQQIVRDYFGSGDAWGVRIEYTVQDEQLGTGHALWIAKDLLKGRFLVANGDTIPGHNDWARIAALKKEAMALFEVEDTKGLGTVEVDGNRVTRINEKLDNPPTKLANAGIYLLNTEIFELLSKTPKSPRGEYEIVDVIQSRVDSGHVVACITLGSWLHMSYSWDLLEANEVLMAQTEHKNLGTVEEGAVLKPPVSIGKNTIIRANSYIVGPVTIGENCDIGPNNFLRPSTCIGNNCHIGASVEVKNCIIMNNSKVPHLTYVGDSVIGEGCNLGAGTKVANLRLDKRNITVNGIDTGRRKLGVIMGDGVQTGINSSINIGCVLGNGTIVAPGALATGVIAPRSRIVRRSR